jgi:toxin ParE1/3/4
MKKRKYKLRINRFAQSDLENAWDYYENKEKGLGGEFWMEAKDKLDEIEKNPMQFQIIKDETRRANLKRFPFGIFFVVNEIYINVFGLIHFSRSPITWQKRVENMDDGQ